MAELIAGQFRYFCVLSAVEQSQRKCMGLWFKTLAEVDARFGHDPAVKVYECVSVPFELVKEAGKLAGEARITKDVSLAASERQMAEQLEKERLAKLKEKYPNG